MKRLLAVCTLAAMLVLPGCGDDDKEASAGADSSSSSTTASSTTTTTTKARFDESAVISSDGLGDLKIGMSLPEAKAVVGENAEYKTGSPGQTDEACGFLTLPVKDTATTFFRLDEQSKPIPDVLVEIAATNPAIKTDKGIHVGTTLAEFKQAHPEIKVAADRYSYVARWPKGAKGELRADWEEKYQQGTPLPDTAKITGLVIRRLAEVDNSELCS
jgi:hypothetical protein